MENKTDYQYQKVRSYRKEIWQTIGHNQDVADIIIPSVGLVITILYVTVMLHNPKVVMEHRIITTTGLFATLMGVTWEIAALIWASHLMKRKSDLLDEWLVNGNPDADEELYQLSSKMVKIGLVSWYIATVLLIIGVLILPFLLIL